MATPTGAGRLLEGLEQLRARVGELSLPLQSAGSMTARATQRDMLAQLDDYVLPRLREVEAPLLAVVGGSTGAGKSTLVNSVIGSALTPMGVLRPTTRAAVLVHAPDDERWFAGTRVLGSLPRVTGPSNDTGVLRLVAAPDWPPGLALLDAPDIDSVVQENRAFATDLLAAADLWVFVTSATRYADEVPWTFLREASGRGASLAVVLDRVPPAASREIVPHLAEMLLAQGLGAAPLFVVEEGAIAADGLLTPEAVAPLAQWLRSLADAPEARREVVRRTLDGAVGALLGKVPALLEAVAEQQATAARLVSEVDGPYDLAEDTVRTATADGSLLRGEVLARWQEFVGTGEFFRQVERTVGSWRDRITAFLRGTQVAPTDVGEAIGTGLLTVVVEAADEAAERTYAQWRSEPAGAALLAQAGGDLARASEGLSERTAREMREWQGAVLELVRTEGQAKRGTARALAFGVNGVAIALMIAVFASTAFIPTGAELAVGGGTALVGQRLLEAVFGDEAARRLAEKARQDLTARVERLLDAERSRYLVLVDTAAAAALDAAPMHSAARAVQAAR